MPYRPQQHKPKTKITIHTSPRVSVTFERENTVFSVCTLTDRSNAIGYKQDQQITVYNKAKTLSILHPHYSFEMQNEILFNHLNFTFWMNVSFLFVLFEVISKYSMCQMCVQIMKLHVATWVLARVTDLFVIAVCQEIFRCMLHVTKWKSQKLWH